MVLTSEFIDAVSSRNLLRVRIMLKDSLLVDKQFNLFREMRTYAENKGLNIWMDKTEDIEIADKAEWNLDLMNLELTRLVNDFTKERIEYCQKLIKKVYGITSRPVQNYNQQTSAQTRPVQPHSQEPCRTNRKPKDYDTILKGIDKINRILKKNKLPDKSRIWPYDEIEKIQVAANEISRACENIKSRRG